MADTVATQTLLDGDRLVIQKFTNISDGTGEAAVNKIIVSGLAASAAGFASDGVKINRIWANTHGMQVRILWDATTDFSDFGGLTNNAGAGKTGNVAFTTSDASSGDMYTIVVECIKTYATV